GILTNDAAFAPAAVSVNNASVLEGAPGGSTMATVFLTLSHPVMDGASVNWTTTAGSASAGIDYTAASGTATFAAGIQSVAIMIPIAGDSLWESDETFNVLLSNPVGLVIDRGAATVTILNDDAAPQVSVAIIDATGSEQNRDPLAFAITRTANLTGDIVVNLSWAGTATLISDYTLSVTGGVLAANGSTLTLASGATSATITVTPVDDTVIETAETVQLAVASGAGYLIGAPSSQTGTIADNDLPRLSVADVSVTEGNSGAKTVAVTVTLSAASPFPVTVSYATSNGTATTPSDYQSASGTLTFAAGVTTQTINVVVVGDRVKESNETFKVILSNPTGATIATSTATVTILDDEKALLADAPSSGRGANGAGLTAAQLTAAQLTAAQLTAVVEQAEAAWLAVNPTADFRDVSFSVVEMDGAILGLTAGREITLDATAAGYGWFIDPTPVGSNDPRRPLLDGRMDLLTVIEHELGHALGLDHDDAPVYGVMDDHLSSGVRYLVRDAAGPASWEIAVGQPSAVRRTETSLIDWDNGNWNGDQPFEAIRSLKGHPFRGLLSKLSRKARWFVS
ncbi:MAG TPA: Calx-beta domain-containing protein, partial [Terriglobia bacterium]|nr:Calx-beta domain-containing protein [Terriglobia bacterium]